jgi:3-oxoacyl-[acyl-carrier-protein] synthase III
MPDGRFSQSAVATRAPARPRELRAASLASISMAVPDRIVGNDVVAAGAGVTEQWIVHRTGVHERRNVSEGETVVTLATQAGRQALEDAGVDAADLDLVLLATVTPDEILPNAAPLVATELGAVRDGRRRRLHRLPVGAVDGDRSGRGRPRRARSRHWR